MVFRVVTSILCGCICLVSVVGTKASLAQPQTKPSGAKLVLLDGSEVRFESLVIDGGKVSGEGVPADLTLDDLRRIELRLPAPAASSAKSVVDLRGGGRVLAKGVSIANEKCRIEWSGGEPLFLPVDLVRAIRLDPESASADFDKAVSAPSAEHDRVFVKDEAGKLSSVTG